MMAMGKIQDKGPYFSYIFSLLLFGANGIVASFIALSSYEIVLLRSLAGGLLLVALFFLTRGRLTFYRHKKPFACLVVSGIAMGASWMLLYEAYARVGVSVATLLYYCGPVIVMVLSPILFGERLTPFKVTGFLAVLCGVFLINGHMPEGGGDPLGMLCGLLGAAMYAVMVIFNKKAAVIKGLENAMLQLVVTFITVAVFVGFKQGFAIQIPAASVLPILVLGLLNTGIGCYLYFSAIGHLPVQTVAICGYLEPLSAVVFSVLFLKETLLPLQAAGAVLILGGAVFGECMRGRREVMYRDD